MRYDDWHNDDDQQDDNANNYAHAHLHVFPPHLLAHTICAAAESLGGDGKVIGLVLKAVKSLSTIGNLVDVFPHDANSIIDLLLDCSSPRVPSRALLRGSSLAAGNVRIVRGIRHVGSSGGSSVGWVCSTV